MRLGLRAVKVRSEQRDDEIRDEPSDPSLEVAAARESRARGPRARGASRPFLVGDAGSAEEPRKLRNLQAGHRLVQRAHLEPAEDHQPEQEPSQRDSALDPAEHLARRDVTHDGPQKPSDSRGGRERREERFGLSRRLPAADAFRHRAVPLQYGRVRAPRSLANHRLEQRQERGAVPFGHAARLFVPPSPSVRWILRSFQR